MLDISNLKFQERDQLVEAFIKYRQKVRGGPGSRVQAEGESKARV